MIRPETADAVHDFHDENFRQTMAQAQSTFYAPRPSGTLQAEIHEQRISELEAKLEKLVPFLRRFFPHVPG
jgi:hypothetical protein